MYKNQTKLPEIMPNSQNISQIKDLNVLINQYPNERVIPQFRKLKQDFPKYRSVRGDGNCFYRAFAFLFLRESDLSNFDSVFKRIQNACMNSPIDFQQISFERSLQEIYEKDIKPISKLNKKERQQKLMDKFNSSLIFDTILIIYFRSLNYFYLKNNIQRFRQFAHDDFQNILRNVCKYNQQSQGVQLASLGSCHDLRLIIMSADQKAVNRFVYNQNNQRKQLTMFLRPGHYDILYQQDSQFIKSTEESQYSRQMKNSYQSPSYSSFKRQEPKIQNSKANTQIKLKSNQSSSINPFTPQVRTKYGGKKKEESSIRQNKNRQTQKVQISSDKNKNQTNSQFKNMNSADQNPGFGKLACQLTMLGGMILGVYLIFTKM